MSPESVGSHQKSSGSGRIGDDVPVGNSDQNEHEKREAILFVVFLSLQPRSDRPSS